MRRGVAAVWAVVFCAMAAWDVQAARVGSLSSLRERVAVHAPETNPPAWIKALPPSIPAENARSVRYSNLAMDFTKEEEETEAAIQKYLKGESSDEAELDSIARTKPGVPTEAKAAESSTKAPLTPLEELATTDQAFTHLYPTKVLEGSHLPGYLDAPWSHRKLNQPIYLRDYINGADADLRANSIPEGPGTFFVSNPTVAPVNVGAGSYYGPSFGYYGTYGTYASPGYFDYPSGGYTHIPARIVAARPEVYSWLRDEGEGAAEASEAAAAATAMS